MQFLFMKFSKQNMLFNTATSGNCYGRHCNLLPRNFIIPFTQTRHPFLGSTLCTQHDEDWLRSCRISTHIQTHSLPPYILVPPPFSCSCDFSREFMIVCRDPRQIHSEDVIASYKWSSNSWFSGTRPLSTTESNYGWATINIEFGRWSALIFEYTLKLFK